LSRTRVGPIDLTKLAVQKLITGRLKYKSDSRFEARRFWDDRFNRYGTSLRGAGMDGLSEEENDRMYQEAARVLLKTFASQGAELATARVLEIGCGPGFYTRLMSANGVRSYVGVDITDVLFPKLKAEFPDFVFIKADVTADQLPGEYDVIFVIDVLEHILTTDALDRALGNVQRVLAPGGLLVIGPSMDRERRHLYYVHFWSVEDVRSRLPDLREEAAVEFRKGYLQSFRPISAPAG
jgi:SAM-dependent methyltransferase